MAIRPERGAARGAADGLHALGDAHGADDPARRRTGTAVARISCPSVALERCSWNGSPPSAAAISGRLE